MSPPCLSTLRAHSFCHQSESHCRPHCQPGPWRRTRLSHRSKYWGMRASSIGSETETPRLIQSSCYQVWGSCPRCQSPLWQWCIPGTHSWAPPTEKGPPFTHSAVVKPVRPLKISGSPITFFTAEHETRWLLISVFIMQHLFVLIMCYYNNNNTNTHSKVVSSPRFVYSYSVVFEILRHKHSIF